MIQSGFVDCKRRDCCWFRRRQDGGLPMLRASFFSIGLFVTLWGTSLLFVDQMVMKQKVSASRTTTAAAAQPAQPAQPQPQTGNAPVAQQGVQQRQMPANQQQMAQRQQQQQRPNGFRGFLGAPVNQPQQQQANYTPASATTTPTEPTPQISKPRVIDPPDWAAFSLLSIGSVTMLYSFAVPRRKD